MSSPTTVVVPAEVVVESPFQHQVGGHSAFARAAAFPDVLVKPVARQSAEPLFYTTLSEDLRDFVPQFFGIVKASFPAESKENADRVHPYSRGNGKRRGKGGNVKSSTGDCYVPMEHTMEKVSTVNPWALHCFENYAQTANPADPQPCILLEDLTKAFSRPCVLDIKMGTRTHAEHASAAKQARAIEKCAQTTSRALGCRICGMQVYDHKTRRYLCRDKYHGRRLDTQTFSLELEAFLAPLPKHRRALAIQSFLRILRRMTRAVQQCPTRFYSTSLLLLYEGDLSASPRADVRMIDFANVVVDMGSEDEQPSTCRGDKGFLLGLRNLTTMLSQLRK